MSEENLRFNFEEPEKLPEEVLETSPVQEVVITKADEIKQDEVQNLSELSEKPKKKKKGGFLSVLRFVGLAIAFGVIAGACFYGVNYYADQYFHTNVLGSEKSFAMNEIKLKDAIADERLPMEDAEKIMTSSTQDASLDMSGVVEATMKSTVSISGSVTTTAQDFGFYSFFGGGGYSYESKTSGSGIIIGMNDTELLMVTNAHVVENVHDLKASLNDGTEVALQVKGAKTNNDIAVVAAKLSDIPQETLAGIKVIEVGDSNALKMGQMVIVIGNAMGNGQSSTFGWVSALNRSVTIDGITFDHLIMTDAAINPGNSGGALINTRGELVGITSSKVASVQIEGMGYAIPISEVYDLINELMNRKIREKVPEDQQSYLGVAGMDITASISSSYGIPEGVLITTVGEGTAAAKAGLFKNDVLVSLDGENISSFEGMREQLKYYAAGETVEMEYYRLVDGEYTLKKAEVTLGSRSKAVGK